ncbi:MAG: hypothetical protein ACJAZO_000565 [Myxococcota bacterium]
MTGNSPNEIIVPGKIDLLHPAFTLTVKDPRLGWQRIGTRVDRITLTFDVSWFSWLTIDRLRLFHTDHERRDRTWPTFGATTRPVHVQAELQPEVLAVLSQEPSLYDIGARLLNAVGTDDWVQINAWWATTVTQADNNGVPVGFRTRGRTTRF